MYIHTKLLFKKRDDYVEVCVYYSRHGAKFRESTGVKAYATSPDDSAKYWTMIHRPYGTLLDARKITIGDTVDYEGDDLEISANILLPCDEHETISFPTNPELLYAFVLAHEEETPIRYALGYTLPRSNHLLNGWQSRLDKI